MNNIFIISESSVGQRGLRQGAERAVFDWVRRASLEADAIGEKGKRGQLWVGGVLGTGAEAGCWRLMGFHQQVALMPLPHLVLVLSWPLAMEGRAGHWASTAVWFFRTSYSKAGQRSRRCTRRMWQPPPPTDTSETHQHVEQFSENTCWTLADLIQPELRKDLWVGRKENMTGTGHVALGGSCERKRSLILGSLFSGRGSAGTHGEPQRIGGE